MHLPDRITSLLRQAPEEYRNHVLMAFTCESRDADGVLHLNWFATKGVSRSIVNGDVNARMPFDLAWEHAKHCKHTGGHHTIVSTPIVATAY